jgi:hypothetical protein
MSSSSSVPFPSEEINKPTKDEIVNMQQILSSNFGEPNMNIRPDVLYTGWDDLIVKLFRQYHGGNLKLSNDMNDYIRSILSEDDRKEKTKYSFSRDLPDNIQTITHTAKFQEPLNCFLDLQKMKAIKRHIVTYVIEPLTYKLHSIKKYYIFTVNVSIDVDEPMFAAYFTYDIAIKYIPPPSSPSSSSSSECTPTPPLLEETRKTMEHFCKSWRDMDMTEDQKNMAAAANSATAEYENSMTEEEREMTTKIPGATIVTSANGTRFVDIPRWIGRSGAYALINNWTVQKIKENGLPMSHRRNRHWPGLECLLLEKEKKKQDASASVIAPPTTTQ